MGPPTDGFVKIFIKSQFFTKPIRGAPKGTDLSGQVAIVTGANTGLGFHAARHLLRLKLSHLIMPVRTLSKGQSAAAKLQSEFPSARIDVWSLDMTSYDSILSFVRRVESDLVRLDIAILNAGLAQTNHELVPSTGHEVTVQVNYLSTLLLAILLLPALKSKSPPGVPGRLTIVGSGVAHSATLPNRNKVPLLASFDDTKVVPWDPMERYPSSKLLLQLFFVRLMEHINADDVIVNMSDPGYCKGSELHRSATGLMGWFLSLTKAISGRTLADGAWTHVDAAVVKGRESHGSFVSDWKIAP